MLVSRFNYYDKEFAKPVNRFTQEFMSAGTSINSTKLPIIFNKIDWENLHNQWKGVDRPTVCDYGCGKFTTHIRKFVESKGFYYFPYDPCYGVRSWVAKEMLNHGMIDIVICSNVLNVIKEDEIVSNIHRWLREDAQFYFISVYEGDGLGYGKQTKKDCWQRNQKIREYLLPDTNEVIKKGVITNTFGSMFIK